MNGPQLARIIGRWSESQGSRPAYARLAEAIRALILDGRLPLETRLPGERELAGALSISRTTVTAAYDQLRTTGYAVSRRGSGTRSALPAHPNAASPSSSWAPFGPDGSDVLDLAHAAPEAPGHALNTAYQAALGQLPRHLPTSGYNLFGLPELRSAVAARFSARGLATEPEQILITSGAQHAFSLVLSLITDPGDRVLIDHPTYPNAIDAIRRAMARPVPVPLLEEGWDLDAFAATLRQTAPRLAYIVPDFHNPTGLLASDEERRGMASALARNRTLTVVDETLAELPLEGDVPPPAATYLPSHLAITIGSASKTLWGGLRVGWIRAEASLIRRLAAARASFDISSPVIDQLVVTELIRALDDILTDRLPQLRDRRDVLLAALEESVPGWSVRRPAGGLVLWCDIGQAASSSLVVAAERQGIRLAGGPRFGIDGAFEQRLRLPYTLPTEMLLRAGEAIGQAFAAVATTPPPVAGQLQDVFA
jgi:DNA-binding transcriptional MocR family regulator